MMEVFFVDKLPDITYHGFADRAKGDVAGQLRFGFEQMVRVVAGLPPASATAALRFLYQPVGQAGDPQSRLKVALLVRAADQAVAETLRILVERGPLAGFYEFRHGDPPPVPWDRLQAMCDVLRQEDAISSLHPPELNDKAPAYYYVPHLLDANPANDYLMLDSVLGGIRESVFVEIAIQPADAAGELAALTRQLAELEAVNRSWDFEDADEPPGTEYEGGSPADGDTTPRALKPFREKDPLADHVRRDVQRVHETFQDVHFLFSIRAFAETPAVAHLVASVVAESSFRRGAYRLLDFDRTQAFLAQAVKAAQDLTVVPPPTHDVIFGDRKPRLYTDLSRMGSLASVDELTGAFRLPLAHRHSPRCIRKNTDPPADERKDLIVLGHDAELGATRLDPGATGVPRGIRVKDLVKHVLLIGVPGMGKTYTELSIAMQCFEHGIPFLIIEPVTTEARMLKTLKDLKEAGTLNTVKDHEDERLRRLGQELRIYAPGKDDISPFRFNPLATVPGISRDEHIENLLSCFQAALPMAGSLPMLIGEGLERVYNDHPDPDNPPLMTDLVKAVREILAGKGYSADVESDLRAMLETRLGALTRRALGNVFRCPAGVPTLEQMTTGATILELDALPETQASLLGLFFLTNLREHIKATPEPGTGVRLVVILDEAHVLLGSGTQSEASEERADPKAYATHLACRALAELRGLQVGMVIANQLASEIAPQVAGLTGSKIVFRVQDNTDAETLSNMLLLSSAEQDDVARLVPQEAYVISEGYYRGRRLTMQDASHTIGRAKPVPRASLVPLIEGEKWFLDAAKRRAPQELSWLTAEIDALWEAAAHEFEALILQKAEADEIKDPQTRRRKLRQVADNAQRLRQSLRRQCDAFERQAYASVLAGSVQAGKRSADVTKLRDECVRSYQSRVKEPVGQLVDRLDACARQCSEQVAKG